jgi:hypothetical protein
MMLARNGGVGGGKLVPATNHDEDSRFQTNTRQELVV